MKRTNLWKALVLSLVITLLIVSTVFAATTYTIPKVSKAPTLDGKLDDEAWKIAEKAGAYFTDFSLNIGGKPSVNTEAWMVWDGENLYIAFRNYQDMSSLKATVTQHDGKVFNDDDNEYFLAPDWPSPRPYYQLITNSLGTRYDKKERDNLAWNCNWKVAIGKLNDSWVSEVCIPLKEIGKEPKEGDEWGFNITRYWDKGRESITFTPGLEAFHTPEKFSILKFGGEPR